MAVYTREYWETITASRSEMDAFLASQSIVYKGFRDRTQEGAMAGALGAIAVAYLTKFFKKGVPGYIATTLYDFIQAIDNEGRIQNANELSFGHTVLTEIDKALNGNSTYTKIEVTVYWREYTDPAGQKTRGVLGNSDEIGKNGGAYQINRIQLSNGNWISA